MDLCPEDLLGFSEIEREKQKGRLLENVIDLLKYENVDFYGKQTAVKRFYFNLTSS